MVQVKKKKEKLAMTTSAEGKKATSLGSAGVSSDQPIWRDSDEAAKTSEDGEGGKEDFKGRWLWRLMG